MHIKKRTVAAIYRLVILILAVVAVWVEFAHFQAAAWRLFATWAMLLVVAYYFVMTIATAFFKKRSARKSFCPMFQGMLLVAGISLLVASTNGLQLSGFSDFANTLIAFIIPALMLGDYFVFSRKGLWRTVEPFYWLALPVIYTSLILITADFANAHTELIYPYPFLYYQEFGIDYMLWSFALIIVVVLVIGYVLVVLDFVVSGEASKHIVMPRIKTVVVEEEIVDEDVVNKPKVDKTTKQKKTQPLKVAKPDTQKQGVKNDTRVVSIKQPNQQQSAPKKSSNNSTKKSKQKSATPKKPNNAAMPKRVREDKPGVRSNNSQSKKKSANKSSDESR